LIKEERAAGEGKNPGGETACAGTGLARESAFLMGRKRRSRVGVSPRKKKSAMEEGRV